VSDGSEGRGDAERQNKEDFHWEDVGTCMCRGERKEKKKREVGERERERWIEEDRERSLVV